MKRGSIGIQNPMTLWYEPNFGNTSAEVIIDGGQKFQLCRLRKWTTSDCLFELRDSDGLVVREWMLKYKWNGSASMDLADGAEPIFQYHEGAFGNPHFRIGDLKIPMFLAVNGSARTYQLGEMKFVHRDFQPCMHFSAPDDQIYEAIIVGDLLYNFPKQDNRSDCG